MPTTVVSSANDGFDDGFGVVPGHAVMTENGVHEETEHAPLIKGPPC